MGLSAWEQQALDSIKSEIAGSDPELAALLSSFTWLASDQEMPEREQVPARRRRALRLPGPGRRHSGIRTAYHRLGFQRAALLSVWALTMAALIAVALVVGTGSDHGTTCTQTMVMTCADQTPGHSPAPSSHSGTVGQAPPQPAAGIPQAGP